MLGGRVSTRAASMGAFHAEVSANLFAAPVSKPLDDTGCRSQFDSIVLTLFRAVEDPEVVYPAVVLNCGLDGNRKRIESSSERQFEGVVEGEILEAERGEGGFGYDPIFRPEGCDRSFAQMDIEEKNGLSHRGQAVRKLAEHIKHISREKSN